MPDALCAVDLYKSQDCSGVSAQLLLTTGADAYFDLAAAQQALAGQVSSLRVMGPNCVAELRHPGMRDYDLAGADLKTIQRNPLNVYWMRGLKQSWKALAAPAALQRNLRSWPPLECAKVDLPTSSGEPVQDLSPPPQPVWNTTGPLPFTDPNPIPQTPTTSSAAEASSGLFFRVAQGNWYSRLASSTGMNQGGRCMCPDGQIYDVEAKSHCKEYMKGSQLRCFGGKEILPPGQNKCARQNGRYDFGGGWDNTTQWSGNYMQVTCAFNTSMSSRADQPSENFVATADEFDHECDFGDLRLDSNGGLIWMYVNGGWAPLGTHYHDENNLVATRACRKLGYDGGFGLVSNYVGSFRYLNHYNRPIDGRSYVFHNLPADPWSPGSMISMDETFLTATGFGTKRGYELRKEGEVRYWCAGKQSATLGSRTQTCNTSRQLPDNKWCANPNKCAAWGGLCPPKSQIPKNDPHLCRSAWGPEKRNDMQWSHRRGYLDPPATESPYTISVMPSKACEDGDVLLNHTNGGNALIFFQNKWVPICRHYFNRNNAGASAFCKKLGFKSGATGTGKATGHGLDFIMLGMCNENEDLLNCTKWSNSRHIGKGVPDSDIQRYSPNSCDSTDDKGDVRIWCATGKTGFVGTTASCNYTATQWPPAVGRACTTTTTTTAFPPELEPPRGKRYPYDLVTCDAPGGQVRQTTCQSLNGTASSAAYTMISQKVVSFFEALPEDDRGHLVGCYLRFAGHDFMDFNRTTNSGGSDGCVDFGDPDNKGLYPCFAGIGEFGRNFTIAAAYAEFCGMVSLADFIVIAAEALMVRARPDWDPTTKKSASLDFSSGFQFGRQTQAFCHNHLLPNPEHSCQAVEDNFINELGLNWTGATALMGVHTVGRAQKIFSGYDGFWNAGAKAREFTNSYYQSLLAVGWVPKKNVSMGKNQWVRGDIGDGACIADGREQEMMLDTDMCLLYTTGNNCRAAVDTCCAWTSEAAGTDGGLGNVPTQCGGFTSSSEDCCGGQMTTCGDETNPAGSLPAGQESASAVKKFANDETSWLVSFVHTWHSVTSLQPPGFSLLIGAC